mmetsp:Transcript_3013/g.7022  ORF Transcript_3013/g.7022 Transcript_3013/m.7022 type:complete len:184 (+) Transcript_3013:225-776(+)
MYGLMALDDSSEVCMMLDQQHLSYLTFPPCLKLQVHGFDIMDITVRTVEVIPSAEPPIASEKIIIIWDIFGLSSRPFDINLRVRRAGKTKQTNELVVPPISPNTVLMSGISMETSRADPQSTKVMPACKLVFIFPSIPNTSTPIVNRQGNITSGKAITTVSTTAPLASSISTSRGEPDPTLAM